MAKKKISESARRSLVKAMSFRSVIIVADTVITYAISHRVDITIGFVVLTNVASTAIYYLHERFWARIGWGETK